MCLTRSSLLLFTLSLLARVAAEVQAARHDKRLSPQEVASLGRAGRRLVEDAANKALVRIIDEGDYGGMLKWREEASWLASASSLTTAEQWLSSQRRSAMVATMASNPAAASTPASIAPADSPGSSLPAPVQPERDPPAPLPTCRSKGPACIPLAHPARLPHASVRNFHPLVLLFRRSRQGQGRGGGGPQARL
jgi:hypothetical protein